MIEEQENPQAEAEEPAAPADEAPAEDAATEAPAEEAAAETTEPEEQLHPKERRRRARSEHTGEARPQRGPEERLAERAERRAANARERRAYRAKQREKRAARPESTQPAAVAAVETGVTGRKRVRQGVVVSASPDKTITVRIDTARRHRTYKKIVRQSTTLHAHDERNEAGVGDMVRVIESRPVSRTKRWRLVEIVERAR
jgi:small subunit ribosomal protein S17